MAPLRTILWTALLTGTGASDTTSLLQRKVSTAAIRKEGAQAKGLHLLETAQTLISKVNAGQDPTQCGIVSDTIRAAVDEAIPAILEQVTHHQNEIDSAAQAVAECPFQGDDLVQEGNNLNSLRQDHATCRMTEQELQDGLQPCHEYEQLRSSGYTCPAFPNDESGYPDALQQARAELELHFNEAVALRDACRAARDALARQQEECASAQSTFEGAFCAHRLNCAAAQDCRTTTEDAYNQIRSEVEAAQTSLESEYELFKHVECLLGHADDALDQQSIVAGDEVAACSDMSQVITAEEREQLSINYPTLDPLTSCDQSVILEPPCEANFFEAAYAGLPQLEAIQAACTSCPPLPGIAGEPLAVDNYIPGANCCGWNQPASYIAFDGPGLVGHHWHNVEVTFEFTGTPIVRGVRVNDFAASGYTAFTSMDGSNWQEQLSQVHGEQRFASPHRAKYGRLVWDSTSNAAGASVGIHAEFLGTQ